MTTKATLMFDKDAFQGLGWRSHEQVAERYDVVVQPPLMHEIAGDYVLRAHVVCSLSSDLVPTA